MTTDHPRRVRAILSKEVYVYAKNLKVGRGLDLKLSNTSKKMKVTMARGPSGVPILNRQLASLPSS
jgi:hypothetical protein